MTALEAGRIDGAVLSRPHCDQLAAKGFTILLDLSNLNVYGAPDALVVMGDFLAGSSKPEAILAAVIESPGFVSSPDHIDAALSATRTTLGLTDDAAAQRGLRELKAMPARKPYPSASRLRDMQRIMTKARPSVASLAVAPQSRRGISVGHGAR